MKNIIKYFLMAFTIYIISKSYHIPVSLDKEVIKTYPTARIMVSGDPLITRVITDINVPVYTVNDGKVSCETRGKYIVCDSAFKNSLTNEQLALVLLHEHGHIVKNHSQITNDYANKIYTPCKESYNHTYCMNLVNTDLEFLYMERQQEYEADMYAYANAHKYTLSNSVCDYLLDYINPSQTDDSLDDHPLPLYRYEICKVTI